MYWILGNSFPQRKRAWFSSVTTFTLAFLEGRYFLEKSVSLSLSGSLPFSPKLVDGSPELKNCQHPFLHLWSWRQQSKLGAVVIPNAHRMMLWSYCEEVASGVSGLELSRTLSSLLSWKYIQGKGLWYPPPLWYLATLSSNPSSALAGPKTV